MSKKEVRGESSRRERWNGRRYEHGAKSPRSRGPPRRRALQQRSSWCFSMLNLFDEANGWFAGHRGRTKMPKSFWGQNWVQHKRGPSFSFPSRPSKQTLFVTYGINFRKIHHCSWISAADIAAKTAKGLSQKLSTYLLWIISPPSPALVFGSFCYLILFSSIFSFIVCIVFNIGSQRGLLGLSNTNFGLRSFSSTSRTFNGPSLLSISSFPRTNSWK